MNHKHPQMPPDRIEVPTADHFVTLSLDKITCKYFSYEMVCFRSNYSTGTPPSVINAYQMCAKFNVQLCADRFLLFRNREDDNSIHSSNIDD